MRACFATVLLLLLSLRAFAQPAIPSEWFYFPTNFVTPLGSAPIAYTTNLISTPMSVDMDPFDGSALILDTTNLNPAYLEYYVTDTNWINNLSYGPPGSVLFFFAPNWASASQGGTGPGETAYFLWSGDTSTNGLFAIYTDEYGSNIYFGGVSNGVATTYASAPISWTSNSWHQIGVEWAGSRSHIYIDGAMAASGQRMSIVPWMGTDTNGFYTNGFFIGSDNQGYEQARGAFWNMVTWSVEYGGLYIDGWSALSNDIVAWQDTLGGSGFGAMMGMGAGGGTLAGLGGGFGGTMATGGLGVLNPANGGCGCITNTNVFLTNVAASLTSGSNMTFSFTIEGGTAGMAYNVYSTTNLWIGNITNAVWTWLGQGTNCGSYSLTNQPPSQQFYVLGITNDNQPIYTRSRDFDIVVYAQPIVNPGNLGTCPGPYEGYITYLPTNGDWGFIPMTNNTTVFTASDTIRTNTRVEYVGAYGDSGCGQTTVTIPNPPYSPAYRFAIYFTNDVPTTNYPISLKGFSP